MPLVGDHLNQCWMMPLGMQFLNRSSTWRLLRNVCCGWLWAQSHFNYGLYCNWYFPSHGINCYGNSSDHQLCEDRSFCDCLRWRFFLILRRSWWHVWGFLLYSESLKNHWRFFRFALVQRMRSVKLLNWWRTHHFVHTYILFYCNKVMIICITSSWYALAACKFSICHTL